MKITLPKQKKGRKSKEGIEQYNLQLEEFANILIKLQLQIAKRETLDDVEEDEKISSRGWCYLLEGYHTITKDQFDICQKVINKCRKEGYLPIDFVAIDKTRLFDHVESLSKYYQSPEKYINGYIDYVSKCNEYKKDWGFWESQKAYIQVMVEKIDVKNIFNNICEKYHIPIANAKGWSDLNERNLMSERFKEAEERGLQPVLLYYGDFDPAGINIAKKIKKNIKDIIKATKWNPEKLIVDHFGLSFEFIEENNLLWIDNLITGSGKNLNDSNHPDHNKDYVQDYIKKYGVRKCEANAILPIKDKAIKIFEDKVLEYLGDNPFKIYNKKIGNEQEKVLDLMNKIELKELLSITKQNLEMIENKDHDSYLSITKKQWLSLRSYILEIINDQIGNDDDIPFIKEIFEYIYNEFVIKRDD